MGIIPGSYCKTDSTCQSSQIFLVFFKNQSQGLYKHQNTKSHIVAWMDLQKVLLLVTTCKNDR